MNGKWQWDDVRFFLAVSREGSLSGAARALGVDHVTVGRRIALLEKQLSAKLLNRTPDGLITTAAGQVILRECEAMEGAALSLERLVSGQDTRAVVTEPVTPAKPPVPPSTVAVIPGFSRANSGERRRRFFLLVRGNERI